MKKCRVKLIIVRESPEMEDAINRYLDIRADKKYRRSNFYKDAIHNIFMMKDDKYRVDYLRLANKGWSEEMNNKQHSPDHIKPIDVNKGYWSMSPETNGNGILDKERIESVAHLDPDSTIYGFAQ